MKKFIALMLCTALIISASACSANKENEKPSEAVTNTATQNEGILNLAYSTIDTLNPFTCTTSANLQILRLIYDGLFSLDKNYNPVPTLAVSGTVEDKTVTVKLGNFSFSDGTPVTVTDVKTSFEKAKASPAYAARLANFESAGAYEGNIVIFTMTKNDPYALACLDFPIIKNGDDATDLATGFGRYIPRVSGDEIYLTVNTAKTGFVPAIKTVKLLPIRDESAIISSLEVGNTCFNYNDLSDGVYSRINAKTVEMGINNFVYLAFNSASEAFADKNIRQAVNLAIDRNKIVSTAFQGHARVAYTPFNPDWYELVSKDLIVSKDVAAATQLIEESGIDVAAKEIVLIVNSENQFKLETGEFIKEQLEVIGFDVTLKKLKAAEIVDALTEGNYDIYIGETKLTPNMNLSALFLGGNASFGISNISETSKRYSQLLSGNCEIMDFVNTFNEDLPVIPLCYRNAAVSYTNSMQGSFACCDGDVFADIHTWSFK